MAMDLGDAKITIQAKDEASAAFSNLQTRLEGMQSSFRKVGIAMTAMGVAGLKLVSDARQLNAQFGQVAITIDSNAAEMRELALSTANVTFSLKSVANTFDLLARAGIRSTEVLKASATAFDALADATGSTAEAVATILIPAYKMFGDKLPETAKEMDKWTWLVKNTTVDLSNFGAVLAYLAPDMDILGLSMEDTIAIMAALEAKGISGAAATRELRKAVTEAVNEEKNLADVLGISAEEIANWKEEIEGATGITQQYADVANEQFGIMDKLKHAFSELTLKLGSFLKPLEPILAAMTALGPAMIFLSTQMGINTLLWVKHTIAVIASKVALLAQAIAAKAATAAMWLLNAAMSVNPFILIATAIAAVATALFIFRDKTDTATKEAIEDFQELATEATIAFDSIALAGKTMSQDLIDNVVPKISQLFDEVILMINTRKEETIAAMYAVFAGMHTVTEEEIGKTATQLTDMFGLWAGEYSGYGEEINEIYRTALANNRELTAVENARINELLLLTAQEGIKITSVGTTRMEDLWRTLGESTGAITKEMYLSMLWGSKEATQQIVSDTTATGIEYKELINELIRLGKVSKEEGQELVTAAELEKNAKIQYYEEETRRLKEELDKRYAESYNFWQRLKDLFWGYKIPVPELTQGLPKVSEFQSGGIVTSPTLAMIGESGPEAVVPLSGSSSSLGHIEQHIHIGSFMGDEMSLRDLTRRLQELMREEERRTAFSGVNAGYFYGGSHL